MRARKEEGRAAPATLEVRAFYTIAELARFAGVTPYMLLRVLRRNRVVFLQAGRALYVPLSEVRERIPPLWEGLKAAEELRSGAASSRAAGGRR